MFSTLLFVRLLLLLFLKEEVDDDDLVLPFLSSDVGAPVDALPLLDDIDMLSSALAVAFTANWYPSQPFSHGILQTDDL